MSATHGKQFTLYGSGGPNPWKVAIVLEELGLEYHTIYLNMKSKEHKQAPYTTLNPNGRVPALIDHSNNDFTIWESGAIILYLVGKYDTQHKISFEGFDTTAIANQYLMFQMSGQGPYFGQLGWFTLYHFEKIPSAIARYEAEVKRVLGVLEDILKDKEYLVGEKASYADLSFVPWNLSLSLLTALDEWRSDFPKVAAWQERLEERASVKKIKVDKAALAKASAKA